MHGKDALAVGTAPEPRRGDDLLVRPVADSGLAVRGDVRRVHGAERRVDLPAYELKPNQVVTVKGKSQQMPAIQGALVDANPPSYVALDKNNLSAQLVRLPEREEIPVICELPLVIEYYSR